MLNAINVTNQTYISLEVNDIYYMAISFEHFLTFRKNSALKPTWDIATSVMLVHLFLLNVLVFFIL